MEESLYASYKEDRTEKNAQTMVIHSDYERLD